MGNTVVALLSNIEANQNEIIAAMLTQITQFVPDLYIVDFYKNNKLGKVLNNDRIKIVKAEQWKFDKWSKIYTRYKYILQDCDNVILIKTPILRDNNVQLDLNMLKDINKNTLKDDTWNMQYDFMKRLIERVIFVKACRKKNVFQFMIDPDEVDFSKLWNFKRYERYAACNWGDVNYGPLYEWALFNTYIQPIPKAQDLYYIASAYTEDREKYLKEVVDVIGSKFGRRRVGFVRNNPTKGKINYFNATDRDTRVTQSTYLYNLMLSRYTLVNESYNKNHFNMVRFMEAVVCNCVPLLLHGMSLKELKLTFPDIYDIIIERELLVKPENVVTRLTKYVEDAPNGSIRKMQTLKEGISNKPDNDVCEVIKNTQSFKNITDYSTIKMFYDNLLE